MAEDLGNYFHQHRLQYGVWEWEKDELFPTGLAWQDLVGGVEMRFGQPGFG